MCEEHIFQCRGDKCDCEDVEGWGPFAWGTCKLKEASKEASKADKVTETEKASETEGVKEAKGDTKATETEGATEAKKE